MIFEWTEEYWYWIETVPVRSKAWCTGYWELLHTCWCAGRWYESVKCERRPLLPSALQLLSCNCGRYPGLRSQREWGSWATELKQTQAQTWTDQMEEGDRTQSWSTGSWLHHRHSLHLSWVTQQKCVNWLNREERIQNAYRDSRYRRQ